MQQTATAVPAGASSLSPDKGYKWIAKEIDRLDPETDYARIWALSIIYYGDDMFVNLLYATGMPCFTQSPFGSKLLAMRSGKALEYKHERCYDTLSHFWKWFEFGPQHIDTERSLEKVNRIHEGMAKLVPEAFTNDDFIYTMAWLGTFTHRLNGFLGRPGFNGKQQIAAHHFWRDVSTKMRGPHGYVHDFPKDFAEMLTFVKEFESRPWQQTDTGKELAASLIDQFNEARLPRWLWPLGHQLILTVQAKHIRDLHRMGDPNPVAEWLIKKVLAFKHWLDVDVLPDPRHNIAENARAKGNTEAQHREPPMVKASQCPFHAMKDMFSKGTTNETGEKISEPA